MLPVQFALAERRLHQSVKVPDLAVAAIAERNRIAVLPPSDTVATSVSEEES